MLSQLDMLETMKDKIPANMRPMIAKVKHIVLDKVSCVTACLHIDETTGKCHEQSCMFHYQPGRTTTQQPTICADSVSIMATNYESVGNVHFAIKTFPIEPEDDMIPTEFYNDMDSKFKFRRRLEDGALVESPAAVCHAFKNASCPEHPPPSAINAGDTLYIAVVSIDEKGKYKMVPPGSFRVIAIGSETGTSCESGATLGPTGLRSRRSKARSKVLAARALEAKRKIERHKPKKKEQGGGGGPGGGLGSMIMNREEGQNPE